MQTSYLITIVTIVAGVIIFIFKICFASKCGRVSLCWGIINIDREVNLESKEFHNGSFTPQQFKRIENVSNNGFPQQELVESKV